MKRFLIVVLAMVLCVTLTPTASAIDLEPGECYQFTRSELLSCGGWATVTYERCMDEFGEMHTEVISASAWCP